jgi:hypothetical protein
VVRVVPVLLLLLPLHDPSHRGDASITSISPRVRIPRSERIHDLAINMMPNSPGNSAAKKIGGPLSGRACAIVAAVVVILTVTVVA